MNPDVTVLMSVHNGMPYLAESVDSILRQTHKDFEFLILDDASTDESPAYLRGIPDPRVRVVRLDENIGLTAALNRGLREARGAYIARQDADDISHPGRLAAQMAFLRENPKCAAVGAQCTVIDARGRSQGRKDFPQSHGGIMLAHLFDNALAHSAVTFRRDAVLAAGGYDEAWPASQDYELWSRLSELHEFANLPQRLVSLRVLESSITRQHKRPELIRRVQAAHYRRITGSDPLDSDLDLIALFRSRVVPERLREFRALLEEVVSACEHSRPGLTRESDFRRTLAMIHERVGYNLLTFSRMSGLGEIARAFQAWPRSVFSMPWLKIGALAVLGDSVRRWYEKATR